MGQSGFPQCTTQIRNFTDSIELYIESQRSQAGAITEPAQPEGWEKGWVGPRGDTSAWIPCEIPWRTDLQRATSSSHQKTTLCFEGCFHGVSSLLHGSIASGFHCFRKKSAIIYVIIFPASLRIFLIIVFQEFDGCFFFEFIFLKVI